MSVFLSVRLTFYGLQHVSYASGAFPYSPGRRYLLNPCWKFQVGATWQGGNNATGIVIMKYRGRETCGGVLAPAG
jgi:hypothetical protein